MALTRRELIKGSVAAAALAVSRVPLVSLGASEVHAEGTPIAFLDVIPKNPNRPMVQWDKLTEWITPEEDLFSVSHYGSPKVDIDKWSLEITGLVKAQRNFTLKDLQAKPRREITATIECSGNSSSPAFMGAVGNAKWTGVPLAHLLRQCDVKKEAIEVVFFGSDEKVEKIKDNDYLQNFARSMSVADAMDPRILLAYEMNGKPLAPGHGFPLRLVVPGWYGVAWVKWLKRIELVDKRFMGRFMARDYVTIRGEERPDCTVWRETSVTRMNVKSFVARAARLDDGTIRISGAAWTDGTPLERVEVKVDDGKWVPAALDKPQSKYAWTFWHYDWRGAKPGEHTVVSRATDANGVVQPTADDPRIKLKKTYYEANQQYPRKLKI